MTLFDRLVNAITSGRGPFASNRPVPQASDLLVETSAKNAAAVRRFLRDGAWTKETDDA